MSFLYSFLFLGRRCESVINGCKGKSCKNGGICVVVFNIVRGFICRCSAVGVVTGGGREGWIFISVLGSF